MKKLIATIILGVAFFGAFAQQNFKPIHFTKITTTDPVSESKTEGSINISTKDSVILINEKTVKKLSVVAVDQEQTSMTENHILVIWWRFLCTISDNKYCTVTLVRQKETGKKDLMIVKVDYDNDGKISTSYDCDYLKDLY